jgi:hypothetical protein
MAPLEFMQSLAALGPRPKLHLIRFHGVLASNAKWGSLVVPPAPNDSPLVKPAAPDSQETPEHGRPLRLGRAKLLKRVLNLDLIHRPNCDGNLRIIAAITRREAVEKIQSHLGLDPTPAREPARGQIEHHLLCVPCTQLFD